MSDLVTLQPHKCHHMYEIRQFICTCNMTASFKTHGFTSLVQDDLSWKPPGFGLWPPLESSVRPSFFCGNWAGISWAFGHGTTARNCPLPIYVNIVVATFLQAIFTSGHVQQPESETEFNLNLADDESTLNLGDGKPALNLDDGESTLNIVVEMNLLWTFVEVWDT